MLNYETLLSSYDDKLTLMQWLKKVEKALAGASASSFEVIKTGNATIRFRIDFEDGTFLESGDIVLQQGESVSSGEIRNGHLYLTLTNGQELDCGELFNGEIPSLEVRSLEVTGGLLVGDDANATIGGDLVVHGLTEVQNILAYGHVETETLTAAGDEISAQKPVVEVMTGYSMIPTTISDVSMSPVYGGACKNGNKLTFVYTANIKRTSLIGGPVSLLNIYIPSNIGSKLAVAFGSISLLRGSFYFSCVADSAKDKAIVLSLVKDSNTNLRLTTSKLDDLDVNENYFMRFEVTFLLSDNLTA